MKQKILNSNDNLKTIYGKYTKIKGEGTKDEEKFWKDFFRNQREYKTELYGGYGPLYLSEEDTRTIKNKHTTTPQNTITNHKYIISTKYENLEKHKNYVHRYNGSSLLVAEFEWKDKEIRTRQDFNKTEVNHIIQELNYYSIRKLEDANYANKITYTRLINKQLNRFKTNNLSKNCFINTNNEDIIMAEPSKKFSNLLNRMIEMKREHKDSSNYMIIRQESVDPFKRVKSFII